MGDDRGPFSAGVASTPRLALGIDASTSAWSTTNPKGFGHLSNVVYESNATVTADLKRLGATDVKFFSKNGSAGFVAVCRDRVIVAFRGTEEHDKADWGHDLDIGLVPRLGGRVHEGFSNSLDSLWPQMSAEIKRLVTEKERPVFLTGHSMGGAMATLAALELANDGITPRAVYTYGSPPVGDAAFAAAYDKAVPRAHRVVNQTDDVPRLLAPGYEHVGEERYLSSDGDAQTGTGFFGKFFDRFSRRLDEPVGAGITDHRMNTYEKMLAQLR